MSEIPVSYMNGKILISSPHAENREVIYVCGHDNFGAMGLVLNNPLPGATFASLVEKVGLEVMGPIGAYPVFDGGPVDISRGFILHTEDYANESTVHIRDGVCITATLKIIQDMIDNKGPKRFFVSLGYTAWGPGQLEQQLQQNNWLHIEGDQDLIFSPDYALLWQRSFDRLGINAGDYSLDVGHG